MTLCVRGGCHGGAEPVAAEGSLSSRERGRVERGRQRLQLGERERDKGGEDDSLFLS